MLLLIRFETHGDHLVVVTTGDQRVQLVAQRWRAVDVDLAAHFDDHASTLLAGAHRQVHSASIAPRYCAPSNHCAAQPVIREH